MARKKTHYKDKRYHREKGRIHKAQEGLAERSSLRDTSLRSATKRENAAKVQRQAELESLRTFRAAKRERKRVEGELRKEKIGSLLQPLRSIGKMFKPKPYDPTRVTQRIAQIKVRTEALRARAALNQADAQARIDLARSRRELINATRALRAGRPNPFASISRSITRFGQRLPSDAEMERRILGPSRPSVASPRPVQRRDPWRDIVGDIRDVL